MDPNHNYQPHPSFDPNQGFGLMKEEKTFGMLCHLAAFAGFVIPFATILGPLVVWLIKKDRSAYVDAHGKEALNFQISMFIYFSISGLLMFLLIGFITTPVLAVLWLIFVIKASIKANDGSFYRYPMTIRFMK